MKQHPLRQIFEKLVNINAIKCKIGRPPLAIFPETLDPPPGILAKTSSTPPPRVCAAGGVFAGEGAWGPVFYGGDVSMDPCAEI